MEELEEKADTVLVGRTPIVPSAQGVSCAVDGCFRRAVVTCEVRLTHMHLNPDRETHRLPLCDRHEKAFPMLKWQWRRTPDSASSKVTLDGVFALDEMEDPHGRTGDGVTDPKQKSVNAPRDAFIWECPSCARRYYSIQPPGKCPYCLRPVNG